MKTKAALVAATGFVAIAATAPAFAGETLDAIRERGTLICGVSTGLSGFSMPDSEGNWSGIDVDFCHAVAAAILGDSDAVEFVALTAQQRFTALQSGEIDLLSRNTTWTLTRDTALGLNFAGVTFYDGQGFMVPKELGVTSAMELNGAAVCVQPGTTTELNVADFFRANGMEFEPVVIESLEEVNAAYFAGRCDVYTTDASGLASIRATVAPNPDDHTILPELISKEPLGPVVRHGDDEFLDVVKWTLYALIEAEEKGITQANLEEMRASEDPTISRLLGTTAGNGEALGLSEDWAYNAIAAVGNYGEMFERNVGADTPLALERGLNDLWTRGGLMYAMPAR
ncbi:MAG: amino acid ABC transporter substrate-binding protein [Rhodospirillaceae bacterium]|nr:amino acid ABC transporter substrate-binding protein [Rhodospirillaceae bacterium]